MPDVVAKAMAVITGALLVATIGVLWVTSRPPADTRQVVAEFRDAFPAIEGMQVRTDGAASGSTGKIGVTDSGLASITLLVDKSIPAPRADATATIKQLDSTGDSYIAYDPGTAAQPLAERDGKLTIACDAPQPTAPCTNTLASARLDDLVNAFGPPEQAGVKLILQELSNALAMRGDDVNRAALRLVPTLDAANKALDEVNGQNTALKRMITDLEAVTGQAAPRRRELARLIGSLQRTLETTTAETQGLDAGLQVLPATETQLRTTLASLTRAALATRPLAAELADAAPGLRTLLDRAPGFVDDVRFALKQGTPTLELTRKLLIAGAPTIAADPQRVVTGSFDLAPALSNLLKGILGGDDIIKGFFGDEVNGGPETRPGFGFGVGAVASEPGNQPGYPADAQPRNWVRVSGILNCETFGELLGPACLAKALAKKEAQARRPPARKPKPARKAKPKQPRPVLAPSAGSPAEQVGEVLEGVGKILETPGQTIDRVREALRPSERPRASGPARSLLDFLLGD